MSHKILPIIVIYRCQLRDAVAYATFVRQNKFAHLVVYDNSPADYHQTEKNIPHEIHYVHDIHNGGLSKAYNYGATLAKELGYDFVLLLDQDTEFPADALQQYIAATKYHMLIVPNVVLKTGLCFSPVSSGWFGVRPVNLPEGVYSMSTYNAINSGCCVPVDLYWQAGGYNEAVRLDFSDYEFQRRLRNVSTSLYVLPLVARQDFSNDEQNKEKLLTRFHFFLEGANGCELSGVRERMQMFVMVLKHTLALSLRTKNWKFIILYLKKYLLHR